MVALKRIRSDAQEDPDYRLRFLREAQIGATLEHPNVVKALEVGEDASGPFIAFELIEGVTALKLLKHAAFDRRVLSVESVLCIARDVAAGLAYAHAFRGGDGQVLHRDISADNVLVGSDGVARLSDFGVAVVSDMTRMTRTGNVSGKIGHIAPELIEGGAASTRSDAYALGVCLFQLFTGVRPFTGDNDAQVLRAMMFTSAPALRTLRPDVPPAVAEWVDQALARDPEQRRSAAALVEAIPEGALTAHREGLGREVTATALAQARADAPAPPPVVGTRAAEPAPSFAGRGLLVASAVVLAAISAVLVLGRGAPKAVTPDGRPTPAEQVAVDAGSGGVDLGVLVPIDAGDSRPALDAGASALDAGSSSFDAGTTAVLPPTRPPRQAPTLLSFKVVPYAEVFVDGELVGVTPLRPLPVKPGRHAVLLVNNALGARRTQWVTVVEGRTTTVEVNLSKP